MNEKQSNIVGFDILLRAPASGKTPSLENIDRFKPPPENIEKCHQWLASKGVTCHPTEFGLACSAPAEVFESLFNTKVKRGKSAPGVPPWHCSTPPKPPHEIEEYVDQISIPAPPKFY